MVSNSNCSILTDPDRFGYWAQDGTTISAADLTLEWTMSMGKLSCHRAGFFMHIIFCWCVFITGGMAMLSRLIPQIKWTHKWWGRAYGMFMLWATGTSMIIHNSGLPLFTLKLFLVLGICLPAGWFVILLHQDIMQKGATATVMEEVKHGNAPDNLDEALARAKGRIAQRKSFRERVCSMKALHGLLMAMSWFCIAGRIPFESRTFTCHTYPVYKPINSSVFKTKSMDLARLPLQMLPLENKAWEGAPWEPSGPFGGDTHFTLSYLAGCLCICLGVGITIMWKAAQSAAALPIPTSSGKSSSLSMPLSTPTLDVNS